MFKPCSRGCQYTFRLLAFVFAERGERYFRVREVCKEAGVPEQFTRKALQSLVKSGVLKARRGPHGGYTLVGSPYDVSFLDVIKSVDGENTFDGCILGEEGFSDANPCPLHDSWMNVRTVLLDYLASTHVSDGSTHGPGEPRPPEPPGDRAQGVTPPNP